jgi:hypothetical protein
LIRYIRHLETQQELDEADENCTSDAVSAPQESSESRQVMLIETLRNTSHELDCVANRLEGQSLYYRADQLRELANQLRSEARSAQGGWTLEALHHPSQQPPGAKRDLELENESLREELRKTREAMLPSKRQLER